MRNPMIWIAGTVTAVTIGAAAWLALDPLGPGDQYLSDAMVNVDGADIGGPFTLVATDGSTVSSDAVITGPTLVYFGYTFCPDICPVDVQILVDAVDLLSDDDVAVRPVFITIDPERDTAEELGVYAEIMHPEMVALTGTEEQVRAAADAYRVFYQRVDMPDSAAGYLMNHTGYTYLVVPDDGVVALFRRNFPPEQIAEDIQEVLRRL